jgi:hypothetical protein
VPTALPGPGVALSGTILEVSPDGTRRPISASQVLVQVDVAAVTDPNRGGWVPVGTDGRYQVSGVLDGRFVKITGVDTGGPLRHRFCGTNTITRGDTQLDVLLFLPGAGLPTPTLSGQVFTVVDGKRTPLAHAEVYYKSRGYGSDVADSTDTDGRFSLCGIPRIPGTLLMICGNDETAYSEAVNIQANTVIDIDATRFISCLSLPPT